MIKLYFALGAACFAGSAHTQTLSLNDLVGYTSYTPARFENSITRKGYRTAGFGRRTDGSTYTWQDKKRDESIENAIAKTDGENKATIAFQTTSASEAAALSQQLKEEGYHFAESAKNGLYQKGNITIQPLTKQEGDKSVYSFSIERKALPRARDFAYAEDFLQLSSHEHLASVFGEAAVKRDLFYFSESETSPCSVLYPNTGRQVIFIWKDEQNFRNLGFLLIGGQLQVKSAIAYHKQIEQNVWQSRQGIYSGMSLRELQRLNGAAINIWGWQSEQPGVVATDNKGAINFGAVNLVMNCLDCNEDAFYGKAELLNSDTILREGRRVYVSSIIILPKK